MLRAAAPAVLHTWLRLLVALALTVALLDAVGLVQVVGYAALPAVYLGLFAPAGARHDRLRTLAVAVLAGGVLAFLAPYAVQESAIGSALFLAASAFVLALAPEAFPRAASLTVPLLVIAVYSAAHPAADAAPWQRAVAILLAFPAYAAATILFPPLDPRRPLRAGGVAAFTALAEGLDLLARGAPVTPGWTERVTRAWQRGAARLSPRAGLYDGSASSREWLALGEAIGRSVTASSLLPTTPGPNPVVARHADAARGVAALLAGPHRGPGFPPDPTAHPDALGVALAEARAAARRLGRPATPRRITDGPDAPQLPSGWARVRASVTARDPAFLAAGRLAVACGLAGMAGTLLDIGRGYWVVFSAIMVSQAAPGAGRRRMTGRVIGTVAGFAACVATAPLIGEWPRIVLVGLALGLLLPALLAGVVSYAGCMAFATCTVGMVYLALGEEDEFVSYRVADNLLGVLVVAVVTALVWRSDPLAAWRRALAALLTSLGDALAAPAAGRADAAAETALRAAHLRAVTIEADAVPGADRDFEAGWAAVGAANRLRILLAASPAADGEGVPATVEQLRSLAADLTVDAAGRVRVPATTSDIPEAVAHELTHLRASLSRLAGAR